MGVTYIYPNGPKAPTQAQMEKKYACVHVRVDLPADAPPAPSPVVEVVHNFQFNTEAPIEDLQLPLVIVHPLPGFPNAPLYSLAYPDGNTLSVGKLGPAAAAYDVWIFRHPVHSGFFAGL